MSQWIRFVYVSVFIFLVTGFSGIAFAKSEAKNSGKSSATKNLKVVSKLKSSNSERPILNYQHLDKYSGHDLYEYHKALGLLLAEMERFQSLSPNSKSKKAFLLKWIEESYADEPQPEGLPPYRVGQYCLIGGYWGTFRNRENGGLTCDSTNHCSLSGGGEGHRCNPLFFTQDTSGNAFCVQIASDLTTRPERGCVDAFDSVFRRLCPDSGNEPCPAFADHFRASVRNAENGRDDARAMSRYISRIMDQYDRIKQYCFNADGSAKNHEMGQKESCFRLREYYQRLLDTYRQIRPPNFSCIETGIGSTLSTPNGESAAINIERPSAQIGLLALRSRELADTRGFTRFRNARARGEAAIRSTIHSLTAVGVCTNRPVSSEQRATLDELLGQDKLSPQEPAIYSTLFGEGASPQVIRNNGLNNYDQRGRLRDWNNGAGENLKSCQRQELSPQQRRAMCYKLMRACGLRTDSCSEQPQDRDGGDGGGGSTNGSTNGGTNGGGVEIDDGQNNAGGNQGADQGPGPVNQ